LARDQGPHAARAQDRNTLLLPGASLLFTGWNDTELFANVGRGFSPAIARTAAGFPLKPETSVNSQVGLRTRALPALAVEGAVFANFVQDTVVHLPFAIGDQNVFLNSEDSQSRGAEVAARYVSSAARRPVIALAYGYTDAWFTRGLVSGRHVPEVPRHAGSFSIGFEQLNRWHASVTWTHLGGFFTDPANTVPLTLADEAGIWLGSGDAFEVREPVVLGRVPSHTVLGARFSLELSNGRVRVWVQGRNLTDRLYIADLENGARPGPPRTLLFGVELLH
jgi:Fe(3+) dicitrate transport protein